MGNNIEEVLSSVISNEDLMQKIKSTVKNNENSGASSIEDVISLIAPVIQDKNDDANEKNDMQEKKEVKSNASSSLISSLGEIISKNSALLLALKPYLSHERCQLIDGMIKLSQISNVLNII